MALFQCPHCNNAISDKAENCPHCGHSLSVQTSRMYYLLTKENLQLGPMNYQELIHHTICRETLIWYDGLSNWTPAIQIVELHDIVKQIPPVYHESINIPYIKRCISESEKPNSHITKALLLILASFIFFTIWCLPFGITSLIYASKVDSLWAKGDFDGAIDAANKAYKSFRWGIWVGIGTILLLSLIHI